MDVDTRGDFICDLVFSIHTHADGGGWRACAEEPETFDFTERLIPVRSGDCLAASGGFLSQKRSTNSLQISKFQVLVRLGGCIRVYPRRDAT